MTYRCPLQPPHVDEGGQPLLHKNRKECISMGLNNRGTVTHPERQPESAPVAPSAPEAGVPEGVSSPVAPPNEGTPSVKGKKKFSIFRKKAEAAPEGETKKEADDAHPNWVPSGDTTVMFWGTVLSLGRGAITYLDKAIHSKKPYDTSQMELTTAEEKMVAEAMPNLTGRIFRWFGIKSEAAAETFVHGLVIFRIFGRIFLSVGAHFYEEARERGKEKREKEKAAKEEQKQIGEPPTEAADGQNPQ